MLNELVEIIKKMEADGAIIGIDAFVGDERHYWNGEKLCIYEEIEHTNANLEILLGKLVRLHGELTLFLQGRHGNLTDAEKQAIRDVICGIYGVMLKCGLS